MSFEDKLDEIVAWKKENLAWAKKKPLQDWMKQQLVLFHIEREFQTMLHAIKEKEIGIQSKA